MLGRAPALALSDTLAQRGFDLLPESVIAQRVIIGKTFADAMNVDLRDLNSKEFPIGALPIVLVRPQPDIQIVVPQQRIGFAPGVPAKRYCSGHCTMPAATGFNSMYRIQVRRYLSACTRLALWRPSHSVPVRRYWRLMYRT